MEACKRHNLSGKSHDDNYFRYYASRKIEFLEILKVLKGELLGCIFNNVVPDTFSNSIYHNAFSNKSQVKEKLEKERTDEAPPLSIGTQHYKKHLNAYLDEAERVLPELNSLFNDIDEKNDFFHNFIFGFSQFLEEHGLKLRLAQHNDRLASPFWIRSFDALQEIILSPHDDLPQLRCPKQAGFEIQQVKNIVAVNICLENKNEGILLHYNLQPDDNMRKAHGVEKTGYPYPIDILEEVPRIELAVKKGDFYFLNATNIHAIKTNKKSKNLRTTMSWFMGMKDDSTILYWI